MAFSIPPAISQMSTPGRYRVLTVDGTIYHVSQLLSDYDDQNGGVWLTFALLDVFPSAAKQFLQSAGTIPSTVNISYNWISLVM
jgi:hypothetical protein